jgi:heme exporter protein B
VGQTNAGALFLRQTLTIAAKDLRSELRTKEALNASLTFAMVILVLWSFAFDPSSDQIQEFSGGLLWLAYAFAGALALNRSFARETQNDCLDGLLASPVPPAALYLGKSLEPVSLPVFGLFYNVHWAAAFWPLLGVIALGTWALTVIGTMFSALTVNLRLRELMLPTLVYPLMIPALMSAMTLTTDLLAGTPINGENAIWIRLLVAFDVIFTAVAVTMTDTVLVG